MSGRGTLHHSYGWRKKRIKTWQLIVATLFCFALSAFLLRQNNLEMVELREAVITADKEGVDLEGSVERLNQHIFHHMNTTTIRPIELVHSYNRSVKAAIEQSSKRQGKDIYQIATRACERQGVPLTSIAQCAAEYAQRSSGSVEVKNVQLPDKALFTYSFVSPRWTPDLAGLAVLFTVITGVWLFFRLLEVIGVRLLVRRRLRGGF